jgi:2-dehydropantoate 2-reductase
MKFCVYGAGAIGGLLGAHLARIDEDVTLIARGPHLTAIRETGLQTSGHRGDFMVKPRATDDSAEAGPQDYVFVALKAHAVAAVADKMAPLLGPKTSVVMAVNGLPWWYFHGVDGQLKNRRISMVDPGDQQWRHIGPERVIGCVVYPAAEVTVPGRINHVENDRFFLGEPDDSRSDRVLALSKVLAKAGFRAPVKTDIRTEIWVKLWGNVAFNPISALTGGTLKSICEDPLTRSAARAVMGEAEAIANKLGITMPLPADKRIDVPPRSASTRLRCCRISSAAVRSSSTPSLAPSPSSASWLASRRR